MKENNSNSQVDEIRDVSTWRSKPVGIGLAVLIALVIVFLINKCGDKSNVTVNIDHKMISSHKELLTSYFEQGEFYPWYVSSDDHIDHDAMMSNYYGPRFGKKLRSDFIDNIVDFIQNGTYVNIGSNSSSVVSVLGKPNSKVSDHKYGTTIWEYDYGSVTLYKQRVVGYDNQQHRLKIKLVGLDQDCSETPVTLIAATMCDVVNNYGTPDQIEHFRNHGYGSSEIWYYGGSTIEFYHDQIEAYADPYGNLHLRSSDSPILPSKETKLGITWSDFLKKFGAPDTVKPIPEGTVLVYGKNTFLFSRKGILKEINKHTHIVK